MGYDRTITFEKEGVNIYIGMNKVSTSGNEEPEMFIKMWDEDKYLLENFFDKVEMENLYFLLHEILKIKETTNENDN